METISAFKCSYCSALSTTKNDVKSHELRCQFNPKLRSCSSCTFHTLEYDEIAIGHFHHQAVCLVNEDIFEQDKTHCNHYQKIEFDGELGSTQRSYMQELSLQRLLDKINRLQHQYDLRKAPIHVRPEILEILYGEDLLDGCPF